MSAATNTPASTVVNGPVVLPLRTLRKDIGVAVVVLVALALGLLLKAWVEGGTRTFNSAENNFSISYPDGWRTTEITGAELLKAEDPNTGSAFKTNVLVDVRLLDPASPPTLQQLIDRRVVLDGASTGYHFLKSGERTVGGARAAEIEFAWVAQPIDTPGRAALPVVARSREYIVVTKDRVLYITLSAPDSDFSRASELFDRMIGTVKVQ